ncbi:MAG: esterase-like activity of phytase family protein [Pirellulales bacterium]
MSRACFAVVILTLSFHLPSTQAEEAAGFQLEQAGTLRLPADVEKSKGTTAPLTGLSGLAWLGDDRWVAAIDNSDHLVTFRLALSPEGEPNGVSDAAFRPLQHTHDYEDVARCPPHLQAALAAVVSAHSPAPSPWLLLCEEDTPALRVVAFATGSELGTVPLPAAFQSRRPNRGLESVAIDPEGRCIWTATEEALPADGPAATETAGTVVRLTRIPIMESRAATPAVRQFAYAVDPPHQAVRPVAGDSLSGLVSFVALGNERLLVLERSFTAGLPPFESRVYLVDTRSAPDVAGIAGGLAVRPAASRVAKRLLWKAALGVNLEGLAIGPPLADGQQALAAIADNGGTNVPTLLVTFRLTSLGPVTSP